MYSITLWRTANHLVREHVVIPGGFTGDPDIRTHGDGTYTANLLGALVLVHVGPRRFGVREPMPRLTPESVAGLIRSHSARELAALDCMYRPKDVPEAWADELQLGDRARIAAWLHQPATAAWPGRDTDDAEAVLRSYYAWRMRILIDAVLAVDGKVDRLIGMQRAA